MDDEMEGIVIALAGHKAPMDTEYRNCALCGGQGDFEDDAYYDRLEVHRADCPWRMAREWVSAQHTGVRALP